MKTSNAKEKLLTAAYDLMLTKGYRATSVDDLCTVAEVSKGSFYHFFKTKEDLGLALLDDFFEKSRKIVFSGPFKDEPDALKRLFLFLEQTEEKAPTLWNQGCLLGNFATELSSTHPVVRQRVSEILSRVADRLAELFEPIAALHPAEEAFRPRHLAELYSSIIEGSIILSRAHDDWGYLRRGLQNFRRYMELMIKD